MNPNFTADNISLYHGDCLEIMPHLPASSVDLILCDLPYGTTACAWDTVIPFESLWAAYKRLIKPNGAIVLTASQPFTSLLVCSNLEWFRYEWIWDKPKASNYLNARRSPMKAHENICVFSSNAPFYNPQLSKGQSYISKHKPGDSGHCYGEVKTYQFKNDGFRFPRSIISLANEWDSVHPTQKPVPLMAYLIRTYTNADALVLDNCMGSGTTGVACIQEGRQFIGIEKQEDYYCISQRRITEASHQKSLFYFA